MTLIAKVIRKTVARAHKVDRNDHNPGSGFGLTGLRERVALLRGEFRAGPRPNGGFQVHARLPVPAAAR